MGRMQFNHIRPIRLIRPIRPIFFPLRASASPREQKKGAAQRLPNRPLVVECCGVLFLNLLQQRQAGVGVLGYFVSGRKSVDSPFSGYAGEIIEGHLLTAFESLFPLVEEILFAAFCTFYAVSHNLVSGLRLRVEFVEGGWGLKKVRRVRLFLRWRKLRFWRTSSGREWKV